MKGKTTNLRRKKNIKTIFVCLVSALILSLIFRTTALYNNEQENTNIPNVKPRSSNDNAPEQQWNKTWGGNANDSSRSIAVDSDDNIYITGIYDVTTEPPLSISTSKDFVAQPPPQTYGGDIVLLKYDSSGELQWEVTRGSGGRDEGLAIAVDSDDNIYLVGSSDDDDVIFLKYDSAGDLIWDKSWSCLCSAMAIALDSEDNIFITGGQSGSVIIWKYNSLGVLQWETTWSSESMTNIGWGIIADSSNNIYVTGVTYSMVVRGDLFLLKYDSSGELEWETTWGGSEFDDAHSIAIDSSNNIFVAGCCFSFGAGGIDLSVVKFNSVGQLQWNKTWGGSDAEVGWDMLTLDSSGNIYLGASTRSFGSGLSDGILVKFNSTGEQQWNTTWGGSGDEVFYSIIVDSSDNILLTGYTDSFGAGGDDIILVKYSQGANDGIRISGYDSFLLFGVIGFISIIIIKKWRKNHNILIQQS